MTKDHISSIKALLSTKNKIVIVPHKNPDGDAIGSTLGLYHFLLKNEHDVCVIAPNDYPDFLKWIPGESQIIKYDTNNEQADDLINHADIIFTLDFNAFHRTGNMETVLENSKALKIMIDHHQEPDDYATYTYSDVAMSSTCQMVYHFIEKLDKIKDIDKDIATCLYVGIMTDTGSFRFRSTTSTTHRVIAHLIDLGADNNTIHNNIYDTNSHNRLQLLGAALSNLKIVPEYRTAYITLTQNELNKYDYKKGYTEGIVNYALSLNNIIFAAIFIEDKKESIIKISLRSKGDFSVNALSRAHFNGGGHNNAAGGRSDVSMAKTIEYFTSILPKYKKDLNND